MEWIKNSSIVKKPDDSALCAIFTTSVHFLLYHSVDGMWHPSLPVDIEHIDALWDKDIKFFTVIDRFPDE